MPPHLTLKFKGWPMGIPFYFYFGALAIVQTGTLGLLVISYWEQYQIQARLLELVAETHHPIGPSVRVARTPFPFGDPTPPGQIQFGTDPPTFPQIGQF